MVVRLASYEEAAQQNWALALQTYHAALNTYRRVLDAKARRETRANWPRPIPPVVAARPAQRTLPDLNGLTPREREVAHLIAQGYSNQQIAETLVLTRGTVANHVAHILSKVGATNRTQVAARVYSSLGTSAGH